jgi:hypothetical protein
MEKLFYDDSELDIRIKIEVRKGELYSWTLTKSVQRDNLGGDVSFGQHPPHNSALLSGTVGRI